MTEQLASALIVTTGMIGVAIAWLHAQRLTRREDHTIVAVAQPEPEKFAVRHDPVRSSVPLPPRVAAVVIALQGHRIGVVVDMTARVQYALPPAESLTWDRECVIGVSVPDDRNDETVKLMLRDAGFKKTDDGWRWVAPKRLPRAA